MSKKLFTPGPANVPQFIRVQLSKDVIHHRMGDYQAILFHVTDKLKKVFKTDDEVIILTSSGTGAMESSIVNLFSVGDEVLVINTGFFGERFMEIAEGYQLKVHHLDYEWGSTYDINDVKEMFSNHPNIKGVFITHHETSTGVVNNIEEIGEFVNQTGALLIADCISGMVVHPFEFEKWHVDCALASSQKGFLLPPGLAFVALSQKAKEAINHSNLPKYYFDYRKYLNYYKKGQNPFTPSISLVLALDIALDNILIETGLENIVSEKKELRHYAEEQFKQLGFKLFIQDESIRGNVLVPVLSPEGLNLDKMVNYLDTRHNLSVSKGQGSYSNNMLRVGLLGEFTNCDIDDLISKIKEYIELGAN
jgi:aspartate aminotransferase-like enzyme